MYKGTFRTYVPWEERNDYNYLHSLISSKHHLDLTKIKVEIKKMCHITHNKEAETIKYENSYIFIPKSKNGKSKDSSVISLGEGYSLGESYVICNPDEPCHIRTQYKHITSGQSMLPGSYIWWSIDGIPPLNFTYDPEFSFQERKSQTSAYCTTFTAQLSRPFRNPQVSLYGNVKFSGGLMQLLKCYLNAYYSRHGRSSHACIEFRCGGTLRYRYEICHVVIVCAVFSEKNPLPREEYPVIFEELSKSIRYDENGEVAFVKPHVVYFENVVSKYDETFYSWDTYAFALHFPDDNYTLECPQTLNFEESLIHHSTCIRSRNGVCPNIQLDTCTMDSRDV